MSLTRTYQKILPCGAVITGRMLDVFSDDKDGFFIRYATSKHLGARWETVRRGDGVVMGSFAKEKDADQLAAHLMSHTHWQKMLAHSPKAGGA